MPHSQEKSYEWSVMTGTLTFCTTNRDKRIHFKSHFSKNYWSGRDVLQILLERKQHVPLHEILH